ncbi:MAG: DUF692 domain-containing protein [Deltaproteobacteria bacterium]|nr:DUF692 domain-containing protein [Deltaproteobacteria bacterium]
MTAQPSFPFLGFGVGLRTAHYAHLLARWPTCDWFEIISENYMVPGGRPLHVLGKIRERYPVVMHGVSLSIGSADPLDKGYLKRLKALAVDIEPAWVSDHLCWASTGGHNSHDLLPLPYTEETVRHVATRIAQVQDTLGRRFVIENISSYMTYTHSTMTEWDFLTAVVAEADCKILLDINNIYVTAVNHGFDPETYLQAIPADRVAQFHLAGHTDHGAFLLDTHDHPVPPPVWDLYRKAIRRFGPVSTLIEWDDHIPPFPTLLRIARQAKTCYDDDIARNPATNLAMPRCA